MCVPDYVGQYTGLNEIEMKTETETEKLMKEDWSNSKDQGFLEEMIFSM